MSEYVPATQWPSNAKSVTRTQPHLGPIRTLAEAAPTLPDCRAWEPGALWVLLISG